MNWLTGLGLACLPGSVVGFIAYLRSQKMVQDLSIIPSYKANQLQNLLETTFRRNQSNLAQISGKIVCSHPLTAEFSRQPCVYHKSEITWEYDLVECYRKYLDSDGNVTRSQRIDKSTYDHDRRTSSRRNPYSYSRGMADKEQVSFQKKKSNIHSAASELVNYVTQETYYDSETGERFLLERETSRKTETAYSIVRQVPFFVADETGKVKVDPTKAEIEPTLALEAEVSPGQSNSPLSLDLSRRRFSGGGDRETVSFTYKEWIIPTDATVFVMGEVNLEQADPVIRKPISGGRLLISLKSAAALLEEHRLNANTYLTGSLFMLGVGIVTLIHWLESLRSRSPSGSYQGY